MDGQGAGASARVTGAAGARASLDCILSGTVWPRTVVPLGDRALTIHFPDDAPARDVVRCLAARVRADGPAPVTAIVPALRSLTLHYAPTQIGFTALREYVESLLDTLVLVDDPPSAPIVIPVCYGGEFGPDLDAVATTHRATAESIVAAHTSGDYTVAMIGFLPGFPYLEGLVPSLHTPRRATPRTSVPAGSVGIGGSSTGVYPCRSPGGWQLIGRTPRALFDPTRQAPSLLSPGDQVRFVAIAADELRASTEYA